MGKRKTIFSIGLFLLISTLISCNRPDPEVQQSEASESTDIVTLRALTVGTPSTDGMDEFYQQLDALTIPDLGCIVRFDYIPWGDERNQINIAVASGEYDFLPGGVFSDYKIMATKNAFINFYDYMALVPDLESHYKQYREDYLKNCEIDGKLYGIPQYGINDIPFGEGFFYREDLRKEWGLEPITNLETMEAYLYRAKEDVRYQEYPIITDNRIWVNLWYLIAGDKYLEVGNALDTPFVVVAKDDPYTPVSRFETPEFQLVLQKVKQWYDDGILESSILASSNNEGMRGLEMMKEDQKPCETNSTIWVMTRTFIPALYEVNQDWEFGYFDYQMGVTPSYLKDASNNTVISVSSKSKYPEIAVKFIEKAHTNQAYYDLLCYGVEGIHYNLIDSNINYAGIDSQNIFAGWNGVTDHYLSYDSQSVNPKWQEILDSENSKREVIAASAPDHPLNGFIFDVGNVSQEYKAMNENLLRYMQPLYCGVTDNIEADYLNAMQLLKASGLDLYLYEVRNQLEELKEKQELKDKQ